MLRMVLQRSIISPVTKANIAKALPLVTSLKCSFSTENDEGEQKIVNLLKDKIDVVDIQVNDISGGCGSMYEIFVASKDFKGKSMVQQHRLINQILKEEVKAMHGLRIQTVIPKDEDPT